MRARRIVGDHSADGCARACRDVRSETKSARLKEHVQLIEHNPGADADRAFIDVKIVDFVIVAREIDDQSVTNRISDQAGSRSARRDRNIFVRGSSNHRARFLGRRWKSNPERLDLVNGSVGGVQLAG